MGQSAEDVRGPLGCRGGARPPVRDGDRDDIQARHRAFSVLAAGQNDVLLHVNNHHVFLIAATAEGTDWLHRTGQEKQKEITLSMLSCKVGKLPVPTLEWIKGRLGKHNKLPSFQYRYCSLPIASSSSNQICTRSALESLLAQEVVFGPIITVPKYSKDEQGKWQNLLSMGHTKVMYIE